MNVNPFEGKEIWFAVGSQDLYGEEALRQVAEQTADIVNTLNKSDDLPIKITLKPTLKDSDSIKRFMIEASANENVLGVIAWMHTFSPAKMWIRGLKELKKPLLQLATQHHFEIPWDGIDMDFMNLNQSAHGDREFGFILSRMGIRRKIVFGHYTDPEVARKIGVWERACAGWDAANNTKVMRWGDNMRNVAVTEADKVEAEEVFGTSINTWSVNELNDWIDKVTDDEVEALIAEYQRVYDVDPVLLGERRSELETAAREECGMRNMMDHYGCTAATDNFEDLGRMKQLPGVGAQHLMQVGYGFSAEGDWKTAMLVRIGNVMGYGLPGAASLMEDYSYNFVPGREMDMGSHMLEVNPGLGSVDKPRLEIHPLGIGGKDDPVRVVFTAAKKENVPVVSLADMGERFRLTMGMVDLDQPDGSLAALPTPRAIWKPRPDLETMVHCWLLAGGAHHTCMTTNVGREEWEDFARIAGVELATIDENTTFESFEQTLRINDTYYRTGRNNIA
ncbi:MAG TPA: L-arabinose isomerase [Aeriscardovia aeriphila]|uniref:L-arabinose isomerase n=1 Tax=Aeriscardovia aeriphila TaxID=218139 RepID=A0A921FVV9_9BIFI|nr:L-arabinose isomerase [Aeriscardovia aeriphila]